MVSVYRVSEYKSNSSVFGMPLAGGAVASGKSRWTRCISIYFRIVLACSNVAVYSVQLHRQASKGMGGMGGCDHGRVLVCACVCA